MQLGIGNGLALSKSNRLTDSNLEQTGSKSSKLVKEDQACQTFQKQFKGSVQAWAEPLLAPTCNHKKCRGRAHELFFI